MMIDIQFMRYKADHKEETHRRIVRAASRVFRAKGLEGMGIAKLMGQLGLTHGGFYAHFADREALVTEAAVAGLEESEGMMRGALEEGGVPALLDFYLSPAHRDAPETGCLLPALSAEIARHSGASREAFTGRFADLVALLAEHLPAPTREQRVEKAQAMLAAIVGAVALARAVSDPALSADLLRSTRERLLGELA